ncbi:MAG: TonB-dependent receptor plug domain-containing protein, partial [Bacteroidales bacterium]|nr:TonB-dependent receptor plug domain-containing protein [Bacteroidales bacterium]
MKKQNILIFLSLLCSTAMTAQNTSDENDTLSVLVNLNEITITGAPSSSRMILSSLPVSAITMSELGNTASGNIINAITVQPGVSEITTGSGISKPVIRGLGYNRLAVVNDGIRQEGNQWG